MSESAKSDPALNRRVLYSLMLPAVRLALLLRVPMKEFGDLAQMAYFHETRRAGMKMKDVSGVLGISMRKVALLSKRLKENFLNVEAEHSLPRRVEFMLWAGRLSEARLAQVLPEVTAEELEEALATLVAQGRIRVVDASKRIFESARKENRLVTDNWYARLDALDNLGSSVVNTVVARLFDEDARAFARTVSLRILPDDLQSLTRFYQEVVWPKLVSFDDAAADKDEAETIDLSLFWSPYDYARKNPPEE